MKFRDLKNAVASKEKIVWNDPLPIKGNDYEISYIEPLGQFNDFEDEELADVIILIQYNKGGSEAEVFFSEISLK